MTRKIIVNDTPFETRVALIEDGSLVEIFIERKDEENISGSIYKGRIQRVLPGIQAAFVDIGLQQAAFLYAGDVVGEARKEPAVSVQEETEEEEGEAALYSSKWRQNGGQGQLIEDLVKEGQSILVQVAKAPFDRKGARVTANISIPGRFLVLLTSSSHIGISRKIKDPEERARLREIVGAHRGEKFGYIVRTAAEGVEEEKILSEIRLLNRIWENIGQKYAVSTTPTLIHKEFDVRLRSVRDLLMHEAEELVIDNRDGYESILSFVETYMPGLKSGITLYDKKEPIFDAYTLEGDVSRALKKKIWLKSGGYIVIEHTEALVAIDVNTGRYVGKHNLEETILKTNLEAVKEIAYQIRLRDIGGIIIIDFIDMEKQLHREKVFNELRDAFRKDRSKTHILPISELGLIQMTRKRSKKSLNRTLCEPCLYCEGEGYLISKKSICYTIYRELLHKSADSTGNEIVLNVNTEIAELLHGDERRIITDVEETTGKRIVVYPNPHVHIEAFEIEEVQGS